MHELVAEHLDPDGEPDQVIVGIETERGPWVQALLAAGYLVYAVNPLQVARYRERHSTSGAKSDPADAHLLAEMVRVDRAHHRPVAGDSEIAEQVKVAARAHQTMIWSRVRQVNALRSLLREYYPAALVAFGTDLADRDALAVLAAAPSPEQGRRLSQARIETAAPQGRPATQPRRHRDQDQDRAGSEQLTARPGVVPAYAASASALIAVLTTMVAQTEVLAGQVEQGFGQHPDVEIYRSQPGLGTILGARVLAEFGDDPDRYADAKSRKNYSGMSPITRASGTKRVVLARYARNRRLGDALLLQAYTALRILTRQPARYYDQHRARGATHYQALRALANRLVGILHGCLATTPATTSTAPGTPNTNSPPPPEPREPPTAGFLLTSDVQIRVAGPAVPMGERRRHQPSNIDLPDPVRAGPSEQRVLFEKPECVTNRLLMGSFDRRRDRRFGDRPQRRDGLDGGERQVIAGDRIGPRSGQPRDDSGQFPRTIRVPAMLSSEVSGGHLGADPSPDRCRHRPIPRQPVVGLTAAIRRATSTRNGLMSLSKTLNGVPKRMTA